MHGLCLCNMNVTQGFNHCVKLLYYSSPTLRTECLLDYHNNYANYIHNQSSQVENTPSIIIYFGDRRILKRCRIFLTRITDGKNKRETVLGTMFPRAVQPTLLGWVIFIDLD